MSIADTHTVDMIGTIPDTNSVVLSISDHLAWDDQAGEHLLLLQSKINTYLQFIESGEIHTAFPASKGKSIAIRIYFKNEPNEIGLQFIAKAEEVLRGAGIELQTANVPFTPPN